MAAAMAARLAPYAERGVPIVGCEPSCLLTLREEHLALLPGDPRARGGRRPGAAGRGAARRGDRRRRAAPATRRAGAGSGSSSTATATRRRWRVPAATVELLRRIPGAEVVELDAGCCGMAGSFGFEAEHYELSMQIGESRLFPALRGEDAGTLVAATGVSCRQQIAHGVGREATPSRADREGRRCKRPQGVDMSDELISILVLVAIFASGRPCPSTWACSGSWPRSRSARRSGCPRTTSSLGFPGDLFIILVGVTYLFAIANGNGTVNWLVQAAVGRWAAGSRRSRG